MTASSFFIAFFRFLRFYEWDKHEWDFMMFAFNEWDLSIHSTNLKKINRTLVVTAAARSCSSTINHLPRLLSLRLLLITQVSSHSHKVDLYRKISLDSLLSSAHSIFTYDVCSTLPSSPPLHSSALLLTSNQTPSITHLLTHLLTCLLSHSLTRLLTHSLSHWLTHSLILPKHSLPIHRLPNHSPSHAITSESPTHSLAQPLSHYQT